MCVTFRQAGAGEGWKWSRRWLTQKKAPSQTQHYPLRFFFCFMSFFLPLIFSLTAGKQSFPSPPWQSELRRVIPPSTAKSFTFPTQLWTLLHKANAVWVCMCACSKCAFWFTGTQINGRRRLWCAWVAETRDVGVLFALFVSFSLSVDALFALLCVCTYEQ